MSNRPEGESMVITLFALQTCSHCKETKKLLQDRQIPFNIIYVDMLVGDERNDTLRQLKKINPSITFPTLLVGDQAIVGFKKKAIEAALDALREPKCPCS